MANKRKSKVVKQVKQEEYELEGSDDELEDLNEWEELIAEQETQRHHFTTADAINIRDVKVGAKVGRKVRRARHHPHVKLGKVKRMIEQLNTKLFSQYTCKDCQVHVKVDEAELTVECPECGAKCEESEITVTEYRHRVKQAELYVRLHPNERLTSGITRTTPNVYGIKYVRS